MDYKHCFYKEDSYRRAIYVDHFSIGIISTVKVTDIVKVSEFYGPLLTSPSLILQASPSSLFREILMGFRRYVSVRPEVETT